MVCQILVHHLFFMTQKREGSPSLFVIIDLFLNFKIDKYVLTVPDLFT